MTVQGVQGMTIGETIQSQRKKAGLSQEKIAEMVGTSRQAVTKWETDKSIPCMENLISLAKIFGISLTELTTGVCEESNSEKSAAPKKNNPIILLHNLSLLGYVIVAAAGAGFHQYRIFGRGLPYAVWLVITLLGGLCLGIRNMKYRSQYGKLPSLIPDFIFLVIVLFVPRIPVPNGFSILVMQIVAVLYIMLYLYKLCPWRSLWLKDKKEV